MLAVVALRSVAQVLAVPLAVAVPAVMLVLAQLALRVERFLALEPDPLEPLMDSDLEGSVFPQDFRSFKNSFKIILPAPILA